jgi:2-polyprenyl-3-methyl-5-hydroxy-6-metoxy-1,4-benzoquinol methylase
MILDDAYKKQQVRYEFATKYCSGLTLDYTFASIMSYHGSKILLDNDSREIYTYDISDNIHQCSRRSYDSNGKIIYSLEESNFSHKNKSVDCILYSEIINEVVTKEKINYFYNILNENGTLIISTLNGNNKSLIFDNSQNYEFFSKNEFIELLETKFSKIELYSQKLITQKDVIDKRLNLLLLLKIKLRFILSTILLKFDKNSNFYDKYLKGKNTKYENTAGKLNTEEYTIIPYNGKHNPLFFIAVCHKN